MHDVARSGWRDALNARSRRSMVADNLVMTVIALPMIASWVYLAVFWEGRPSPDQYILPLPVLAAGLITLVTVTTWFDIQRRRRQERWFLAATEKTVDPKVLDELVAVSIAAGVDPPQLGVLDQSGVNALVFRPDGAAPRILVTRGALGALTVPELGVMFANLLARLNLGFSVEMSPGGEDAWQADVARISAAADARTMLMLRDPERVLGAMDRIARYGHRVRLEQPVSAGWFYCWPHQPPPLDMPDRVAELVELAGEAGASWWRAARQRQLEDAKAAEAGMQ